MPTSSEIAASLSHLKAARICSSKHTTLDAASKALISQEDLLAERDKQLEDKDRLIAELKKRLAQTSAAAVEDDELTLVASDGATCSIKTSLARSASSYFATAMSWAVEAENSRIEFKDVSIDTLRFVTSGMHAGEVGADLVALPSPQDAAALKKIVSFALRLLMPWLAQAAMRRALESSDAAILVDLLRVAEGCLQRERNVIDMEEFSLWQELSKAAVQRLALLAQVGKVEALTRLPMKDVQRILGLIKDSEWAEWRELAVVAEGAGEVSSPVTEEGCVLRAQKLANGSVNVYVDVAEDQDMPVIIGGHAFVGHGYEIQALGSSRDVFKKASLASIICTKGPSWYSNGLLRPEDRSTFVHGDSYKLRFRVRRTKLHVQCHVLLKCAKSHLPPEAQAEPRLLASALELLRSSSGLEDLYAMLVQYLAEAFWRIYRAASAFKQMSCCDMEAIITHKDLQTGRWGEIGVLVGILTWALGLGRLAPAVGAQMRLRDESEPGLEDVERLLRHVRFPFINMQQIKNLLPVLSQEQRNLIKTSQAFLSGCKEAFEVQTGKRKAEELGVRAQKRAKYGLNVKIPEINSDWFVGALLRA